MSDWKTKVDEFAAGERRELIQLPQGRGVGFADGFDVCWILEGDVLSTLPAPAGDSHVGQALGAFGRIERVRKDVIHVLRHYLASKNIGVRLNASGKWDIQTEGGLESSLSVGASLTALARDGNDVEQCLRALLRHSIVRHPPSTKRVARYLNTPGDPPGERGFEDKTITPGGQTMAGILKLMNLCRAADAIPDDPTEADGKRFADRLAKHEATGPIGQALLRVGERLPGVKPSFELLEDAIVLEFPDGFDSISLSPRARPFARQVREDGPIVTGDRIADDFERVGRLRTVTLRAIDRAADRLGWTIEEASTGLLTGSTVWHLGPETRSITIDIGQTLTEALRRQSPGQFIRSIQGEPTFAEACLDALDAGGEAVPGDVSFKAARGRLAPKPPADSPQLSALTQETIADADRWARQTLEAFKRSEAFWRQLDDRRYVDPSIDTWLEKSEVVEGAGRVEPDAWFYATALRIQLEAGVAGAEAKARELVRRCEVLYEAGDDVIALCWRLRNEFPEIAGQNFAPQPHDDVPHAEARARAGDSIAIRFVGSPEGEPADDEAFALDALPATLRTRDPRARAIAWAEREWRWAPPDLTVFERAICEGWTEVADALDDNPHLVAALLTHAARGRDGLDAPGILMAGDLLLAWSRLKPTDLLARIVVTARSTDIVGKAQEAERAAARRNPKIQAETVGIAIGAMKSWWDQVQTPMAIAWTRWRHAKRG